MMANMKCIHSMRENRCWEVGFHGKKIWSLWQLFFLFKYNTISCAVMFNETLLCSDVNLTCIDSYKREKMINISRDVGSKFVLGGAQVSRGTFLERRALFVELIFVHWTERV